MKKIIIFASLLGLMATTIASCTKDKVNTAITGTWELSSTHIIVVDSTTSPISTYINDTTYAHNHSYTYQFKTDTVIITDYTQVPAQTDTGQYDLSSGVLIVFGTNGGYNDIIGNCTVADNTLTITIVDANPGNYMSLKETYTRQ
jgi:hypothetical protein